MKLLLLISMPAGLQLGDDTNNNPLWDDMGTVITLETGSNANKFTISVITNDELVDDDEVISSPSLTWSKLWWGVRLGGDGTITPNGIHKSTTGDNLLQRSYDLCRRLAVPVSVQVDAPSRRCLSPTSDN